MHLVTAPAFEFLLVILVRLAGGADENIAVGRPAWQVSTLYGAVAERATDGSRVATLDPSCTHTDWAVDPWWYADVGYQATIGNVVVVNRIDANVGRLRDFNVGVMAAAPGGTIDPSDYTLCATYSGAPAGGEVVQIDCDQPVSGRYLVVQQPDNNMKLTLCEVEAREAISIITVTPEFLPPGATLDLSGFGDNLVETCSTIDATSWTSDVTVRVQLATPFKYATFSIFSEGINYEFNRDDCEAVPSFFFTWVLSDDPEVPGYYVRCPLMQSDGVYRVECRCGDGPCEDILLYLSRRSLSQPTRLCHIQ